MTEEQRIDTNNPEVLIVAGALVKPALAVEAAQYVEPADFEDRRLGRIWEAIVSMTDKGMKEDQIDPVGIGKFITSVPEHQRKVAVYCDRLITDMPRFTSLVLSAQRIRRRATMRMALEEMRSIATDLKREIESNAGEMSDLDARLSGLSVAVTKRSDTQKRRLTYKDLAIEVTQYVDDLYTGNKHIHIPTGLPTVDRKLGGGLRPGQLHVLLAGTGAGKTALASQICDSAVHSGNRAIMFSMEVDAFDVCLRDTERVGGFSRWDLRSPEKKDEAHAKFMQAQQDILNRPIQKVIFGEPMSIEGIRQAVLTERLRGGPVRMIAVDHAQVAEPTEEERRTMPRYLQVKRVSEGLRALARQLKIAVLLTAQLNPPPRDAKGEKHKPYMDLVREGRDIINPAEVVMLFWHDKIENNFTGETMIDKSWLRIEKCRAGQEGTIKLFYRGANFRFEEPAEEAK